MKSSESGHQNLKLKTTLQSPKIFADYFICFWLKNAQMI